ncbi:MAG TPA: N-acyl homoserine lactonase family protein [Candidatus Dormibacteraeota bacterium]|nr:N-acyl homoserine lactonase family protein [Candidatus Dormibacteraeota bacterium]
MKLESVSPARLYLFSLSTASIPLASGQSLEMVLPCYLVETTGGHHVLIDSGMAPEAPRPPQAPPSKDQKTVLECLSALHLRPQDIDTVVCTHFDVDHAGFHDSFPHSQFVVQRRHYELARSGDPRFVLARPHWNHPDLHYTQVEGDTELFPGFTLLETSGHAPGHQSVLVRLPKTGPVLLAIDAVVMERLFTPDRRAWLTDDDEVQLRASTSKLLEIVKRERVSMVVFGHDGKQWRTLKKCPEFYD